MNTTAVLIMLAGIFLGNVWKGTIGGAASLALVVLGFLMLVKDARTRNTP